VEAIHRSWDWLSHEPSALVILATAIATFALLTAFVAAAGRLRAVKGRRMIAAVLPDAQPANRAPIASQKSAEMHDHTKHAGVARSQIQRRFSVLRRRVRRSRTLGDNLLFLSRLASAPRQIGAVAPSSSRLGRAMAAELPDDYEFCVELGGGTGSLTRALLSTGMPREKLIVIERDPRLAALLRKRFHGVRVLQGDAQNLTSLLRAEGIAEVDAVFSSLPLRSLPRRVRKSIVAESFATLGAGGIYVQYTYGLLPPVPDEVVRGLSIGGEPQRRVWRNLPPAVVWRYSRTVEPV
jgi:phosphatidylethanolamine/phosphatidyl-N-methylethanolamine N-methyltransferase